ncbi:coniferyl alcohol acyltransferase-like [Miscanthus floridulus]|uniref:coniferyl alcohol acyltransferase-like n=1 Tax=Miscanthus floridulus TaxID=154761 RepID=UPI00345B3179
MVKLEATKEHDDGCDVTVTVAPALPVQERHRLPLSNLDLLLPPLDVSVFFCYLHPAPTAAGLKEALAKTLVAYYPLAGEVVANGDGEPELLCSGRGVDFTETTAAGVELREVRLGAVDEGVEKLVPAKKAGVMAVKLTNFRCCGAVVGCTFDHRVCDAYSFNMFLVAWAATARGSSAPPPAPSFRRSLVAPRNPPHQRAPSTDALIDRLFSPRSAAPPPPAAVGRSVNRIYRIAAADIAALKAWAGPGRTKLEAFTAHLWQLCARAASPRQSQCCMGVVVDGRTRMFPDGAMKAYFGNVLTIPYGVIDSEDLGLMSLAGVADDVHRWVAEAATGDHFRGLVDWVEALRPKPAAARAYLGGTGGNEAMSCIVSSGMTFPVGKADFGTGLPAFASYHFPWPAGAGYVMPMPSARGDGDWLVYVHVAPEVAKVMEEESTVFQALENSYVFE